MDTYNIFTSEFREKGYTVACSPITKSKDCVVTTAFSGFSKNILPAERISKTRTKQAKKIFFSNIREYLNYFTNAYSYVCDMLEVDRVIKENLNKLN